MIARLNNEKVVREELEKQRKELLLKKQALIAENKKRKDDLASLDDQLKRFSECLHVARSSSILMRRPQSRFVFFAALPHHYALVLTATVVAIHPNHLPEGLLVSCAFQYFERTLYPLLFPCQGPLSQIVT